MLAAAAESVRRLWRKKRAFERLAREGQVYLFSGIAYLGVADLIDESEGGARLAAPGEAMLREAAYLLKPRYATVAELTLAWSGGGEAGYRFGRVRSLRGFTVMNMMPLLPARPLPPMFMAMVATSGSAITMAPSAS